MWTESNEGYITEWKKFSMTNEIPEVPRVIFQHVAAFPAADRLY